MLCQVCQRHSSEFHADNPHVYDAFKEKALLLVERGRQRCGARLIAEQLRWDAIMDTATHDRFKLNDHYTPFYVRLFLEECPEHEGVFELRTSLADR